MINEGIGFNLILAVRDHAVIEAEELEQTAVELRQRATAMEGRAKVLREIFAVAAPHFPSAQVRMLKAAKG